MTALLIAVVLLGEKVQDLQCALLRGTGGVGQKTVVAIQQDKEAAAVDRRVDQSPGEKLAIARPHLI